MSDKWIFKILSMQGVRMFSGMTQYRKKSFCKNEIFAIHSQIGEALYSDYVFAQNDRVVVHNIF